MTSSVLGWGEGGVSGAITKFLFSVSHTHLIRIPRQRPVQWTHCASDIPGFQPSITLNLFLTLHFCHMKMSTVALRPLHVICLRQHRQSYEVAGTPEKSRSSAGREKGGRGSYQKLTQSFEMGQGFKTGPTTDDVIYAHRHRPVKPLDNFVITESGLKSVHTSNLVGDICVDVTFSLVFGFRSVLKPYARPTEAPLAGRQRTFLCIGEQKK